MAFRFPGDLARRNDLWNALTQRRDLVTQIPPDRWATDTLQHERRNEPGRSITFAAGVLSDIDRFDPGFFGISPREAQNLDPQQRLALELTWQAFEDAGIPPSAMAGSDCGVYLGISGLDYGMRSLDDLAAMDAHSMTGNTLSVAANRISYVFDLHGPNLAVDTACSSALVALHLACTDLQRGEIPAALIGGVNLLLHPYSFVGFTRASMLSARGRSRAFASDGDGYVRAEGGAMLLLKPLAQAVAQGDRIHAVIRATGNNTDGARKNGLTIPSDEAQTELLRRLLERTGLQADDIDYVEAHGTGTAVGDPIEAGALGRALGRERSSGPLPIGSIKSNLGHMESAAGMAGLIKAVLVLQHGTIPPSIHSEKLNPALKLELNNLLVVRQQQPLPILDRPHRVGVNSFGFGGANAHALLESAPTTSLPASPAAATPPPLFLSTRSPATLGSLAAAYHEQLRNAPETLTAVAWNAAHRREWLEYRCAVYADTTDTLLQRLEAFARDPDAPDLPGVVREQALEAGKARALGDTLGIGLIYSGNGAQWAGMGCALLEASGDFARMLEELEPLIQHHGGFSLLSELRADPESSRMDDTAVAQPLIFAIQAGLTRLLLAHGIKPRATMGHSVGEVAAAWAAGIYTLEQAASLVCNRSRAQATTRGQGRMMAINLDPEALQQELGHLGLQDAWIEPAANNAPAQLTLAGDEETLLRLGQHLDAKGIFNRLLDLDYAFHSCAMDPIRGELEHRLQGLAPASGDCMFVSSVTGTRLEGRELTSDYWWRNVREPVAFEQATRTLLACGCGILVEIGPDAILNRYLTQTVQAHGSPARVLPLVRRKADGMDAVESGVHRIHLLTGPASARARFPATAPFVELPFTPFQYERFWTQPTPEGYRLIQRNRVHPLLGYPLKEIAHGWENPLDTTVLPYLADHRVGGAPIMPAAGFIEMALAAAVETFGLERVDIEALEVRQPLIFEPHQGRLIRLIMDAEDGRFVIRSKPRLSESEWMDHAMGRVLGQPSRAATSDSPAEGGACCVTTTNGIDATTHYARARRVGLEYGPAFQGISRIEQSGHRLVAAFALPEFVTEDRDYYCHPCILDLCFQSLLSHPALDALFERGLTMLPVGVGRFLWLGSSRGTRSSPAVGCRAEVIRQGPQSLVADFALFDDTGATIALLRCCRFRLAAVGRSSREPLHWHLETIPVAGITPPRWLHGKEWEQGLRSAATPLLKTREHQSFLTDGRPLLDALLSAAALEAWQKCFAMAPVSHQALAAQAGDALALDWLYWIADLLVAHGWLVPSNDIQNGSGWVPTSEPLPPPAGTIWQSLLADYPELAPELILLGRLGRSFPALFDSRPAASSAETLREVIADSPHLTALRRVSASVAGRNVLARAAFEQIFDHLVPGTSLRILQVGGHWLNLADQIAQHPAGRGAHLTLTSLHVDDREAMQARYARDPRVTLIEPEFEGVTGEGSRAVFDLVLWVKDGELDTSASDSLLRRLRPRLTPDGRLLITGLTEAAYWSALMAAASGEPPVLAEPSPEARSEALPGFRILGQVFESDSEPQTAFTLLAEVQNTGESTEASGITNAGTTLGGRYTVVGAKPASAICAPPPTADLVARLAMAGATTEEFQLEDLTTATEIPIANDWVVVFSRCADQIAPDSGMLAGLLQLCNRWAAMEQPPRLTWLLPGGAGISDAMDAAAQPPDAWNTALWAFGRVVMNEYPCLDLHLIDPGADWSLPNEALLHALARPDDEREVVLRNGVREALRLDEARPLPQPASPAERFELRFDLPGQLRNLAWRRVDARDPGAREVEVAVRSVGLNFRDVMYALGLLSDEIIEDGFSGPSLGLEFSGVVTRIGAEVTEIAPGDAVLGFGPQCFASHVITQAGAVYRKPESWSFTAAATIPTVFFTAWYALVELARLQSGERVLIHGAAGGVGLAAIALAHQFGAEVFATAGTPEKREFLKMMGVTHVHDSRSLDFADEILHETNGAGVDVVLNSLAGEAINRNLRVLKPFGRFLELGKRDFVENTRIGLRPFRNNLSYFGIDADQLMSAHPDLTARVFADLMAWMETHEISPLPHRCFSADRVIEAFRYMQQSRQIGKIVVSLSLPPMLPPQPRRAGTFRVRSDAVYLITGGLSGLGLVTARWLLERGAGHIVLVGRRGAQTPDLEARLATLAAWRKRVTVQACDVSERDQLARLLETIESSEQPLRGIFHAATVLDDALLANLDEKRIAAVMAAKAGGAWHLHELTRNHPLDAFVLFSSVTTWLGNPGQASYVAANGYLEGLAQARRAAGLPATCLSFGPIGDVGMLADNEVIRTALEARLGGAALTGEQAIMELDLALGQGRSGEAVSPLDWHALSRALPLATKPLFERLQRRAGPGGRDDTDLREVLRNMDEGEARELVSQWIAEEVAEVLGLSAERIDPRRSLFDMGMDSLMGVELALALEKRLGVRIPAMALGEASSIEALAERLLRALDTCDPEEIGADTTTQQMAETLAAQHAADIDETTMNAIVRDATAQHDSR